MTTIEDVLKGLTQYPLPSETLKSVAARRGYNLSDEANPSIIRVERAHTVIKKYATAEPTAEITIGQADAVPVLDTAYRNLYVRTDSKDWE